MEIAAVARAAWRRFRRRRCSPARPDSIPLRDSSSRASVDSGSFGIARSYDFTPEVPRPRSFRRLLVSGALASALAVVMVLHAFPRRNMRSRTDARPARSFFPASSPDISSCFLPIAWTLGSFARFARCVRWLDRLLHSASSRSRLRTRARDGWVSRRLLHFSLRFGRARARPAALLAIGGAVAVLLLFNAHHDPSEDYTRLSIWQAALQIADRFPLTGVGPFNFSRLYALTRAPDGDPTAFHAHSLYLTFYVEFGIVGLTRSRLDGLALRRELRRRIAASAAPRAFLAAGVAAGLFGVAVQGLIDTVTVVIFGLWMPIMGLALASAEGGEPDPETRARAPRPFPNGRAALQRLLAIRRRPKRRPRPRLRERHAPRHATRPKDHRPGDGSPAGSSHSASPQPRRLRFAGKLVREQGASGCRACRSFKSARHVSRPKRGDVRRNAPQAVVDQTANTVTLT